MTTTQRPKPCKCRKPKANLAVLACALCNGTLSGGQKQLLLTKRVQEVSDRVSEIARRLEAAPTPAAMVWIPTSEKAEELREPGYTVRYIARKTPELIGAELQPNKKWRYRRGVDLRGQP